MPTHERINFDHETISRHLNRIRVAAEDELSYLSGQLAFAPNAVNAVGPDVGERVVAALARARHGALIQATRVRDAAAVAHHTVFSFQQADEDVASELEQVGEV